MLLIIIWYIVHSSKSLTKKYTEIKYDGTPRAFEKTLQQCIDYYYYFHISSVQNLCCEIVVVDEASTVNVTCIIITRIVSFQ